jgi:ABC-type uncharacterized transport system YnjBCD permease subunit
MFDLTFSGRYFIFLSVYLVPSLATAWQNITSRISKISGTTTLSGI